MLGTAVPRGTISHTDALGDLYMPVKRTSAEYGFGSAFGAYQCHNVDLRLQVRLNLLDESMHTSGHASPHQILLDR